MIPTAMAEELEATVAKLQSLLKEQVAQIQKVSAQLEVGKSVPQMVLNDRWSGLARSGLAETHSVMISSPIRHSRPDKIPKTRYLFPSYGIEWPLLVWTDCRSGRSTIPLRLISSRKLAAVTGWPRSV